MIRNRAAVPAEIEDDYTSRNIMTKALRKGIEKAEEKESEKSFRQSIAKDVQAMKNLFHGVNDPLRRTPPKAIRTPNHMVRTVVLDVLTD